MSIKSDFLAALPAAPGGGTREVNIDRVNLDGIDTVRVTAIYKYSDGTNISIINSYPTVTSDANDLANALAAFAASAVYTINLITV